MEDGAIALEHLEVELLSDRDGDHAVAIKIPPPSTHRFRDVTTFPLASQPPSLRGGRVALGCDPWLFSPTEDEEIPLPTPIVCKSLENKLEVSRGKRKF